MSLNGKLAGTVDALLHRSPAQSFWRWRSSRRLVVLAYHEIRDVGVFADQIGHLKATMRPVSLAEVLGAIRTGRSLPRGAVLVTFDDGDRTLHDDARPVLQMAGVPAVAFVVPGLLDTDIPFWWREVEALVRRGGRVAGLPSTADACVAALKLVPDTDRRRYIDELRRSAGQPRVSAAQLRRSELPVLESAGITIGNHTDSHPCLDRCSVGAMETEIVRAHEALTEVLGGPPKAFAYPNGNGDARAVDVLRRLEYEAGFLFDHRVGGFPPADRYRISRVRADAASPPHRFSILVSGLHSSVHHLIGRG